MLVYACLLSAVLVHAVHGDACGLGPGEPVGYVEDPELDEMSALAASRQQEVLWTLNDKNGPHSVFAVSYSGEKLLEAKLDGTVNVDWEDLAIIDTVIGESFIYVANTGNNDHDRNPVSIYRFAEPLVDRADSKKIITIDKDAIQELKVSWPNNIIYDCEAIALDQSNGDIYLFTKDRVNTLSEVFRYPAPQDPSITFTLEHVAQLPCFWVTGADISPNGKYLGLTNKQIGYGWELPEGTSWFEYLSTAPQPCTLEFEEEEQRESIAVTDDGIWTTSECEACFLWFYQRL